MGRPRPGADALPRRRRDRPFCPRQARPVIGALQRRFPGLRPVLFYTPYEAAAWTIISQRIRMTQAARVKARLADQLGDRGAFLAPARLAQLTAPQQGLTTRKFDQRHTLAAAAHDGALTREQLRAMTYEDG